MEPALPQFIHFGREICNDLDAAERREWWLANGLGGYAAGTVAGTLTRRYHGLLIAPLKPPLGRTLLFAKADASLILDGVSIPLNSNRWAPGIVEPQGYLRLESFHLDGRLPVWRYALGDTRLEARIWMQSGANTTYLAWKLLSAPLQDQHLQLSVRLLVNARDHHTQTGSAAFTAHIEHVQQELLVTLPQETLLRFRSRCGRFTPEYSWIDQFDLLAERARGLPEQDNHLCVAELNLPLHQGEWVGLVASLEQDPSPYLDESLRRRQQDDASLLRMTKVQSACLADAPAWIDQLVLSADSFLIQRPQPDHGTSVIAGYPWFGDWGRDTFIALPGLTLPTHRYNAARNILESWAHYIEDGLLPNYFPENGMTPEYNAADAALWYIEAWRAYIEASHDLIALARHYSALASVIQHYANGTRLGIAQDASDGLLRAGNPDSQLTWMDARTDNRPVTPRAGKPVELNALWYNALMSMENFAQLLNQESSPYSHLANEARQGFQRFIRADGEGLYDVLDGFAASDAAIRPNQILAVSLAYSPLSHPDQLAVTRIVATRLATSYGLRTLDPAHPDYQARYAGGVQARDTAYHQGPVWAWLLGHYALAVHRVTGDAAYAQSLLDPLADHLCDAGLGTVSELFDAEPPHTPRGAPAQAWSVACTLMAWCQLEIARRTTSATQQ